MLKRFGLGSVLFLALAAGCAGSEAQGEAAPSDASIDVVLGLLRDQSGLERFALDVNDPNSEEYGAFLSVEEIASRFGASDDVKATVREYFDGRAESVVFDAQSRLARAARTASRSVWGRRSPFGSPGTSVTSASGSHRTPTARTHQPA